MSRHQFGLFYLFHKTVVKNTVLLIELAKDSGQDKVLLPILIDEIGFNQLTLNLIKDSDGEISTKNMDKIVNMSKWESTIWRNMTDVQSRLITLKFIAKSSRHFITIFTIIFRPLIFYESPGCGKEKFQVQPNL